MTYWFALFAVSLSADNSSVSPRSDALDLLILGDDPTRLELRISHQGKSVPAIWDETFTRLQAFHDRDCNGSLDPTEASRLSSPFALRQVLWGQIIPQTGNAPVFSELDLNQSGSVSRDELADYYRRAGLGGALVGVGKPTATDALTEALLKYLDTNKDGQVEEAEWKAAPASLRKLDKNDDELIGPGELVEKVIYPGATGAILCSAPSPDAKPDPTIDALPFLVLPQRTTDSHWRVVAQVRRPNWKPEALKSLRQAPATTWEVQLGAEKPILQVLGEKPPTNARLRLSSKTLQLELRTDEGKLKAQTATAIKRYKTLFTECDTDADGALDEKEIATPKSAPFLQTAKSADRNGDDQLSEKEFTTWLDLQEQIAQGHVLVSVLDHGHGLFEMLDTDHDGSLSVRELRNAWDRLQDSGCITDDRFDRKKLPRQLLATVSHGHPQVSLGKPVRTGPAWFLAMDRNNDGDVSCKEWVGDQDLFQKLDTNSDGLLTAVEAKP
ncbi:MAG: EF-hand domain-containing protein [Fimbriiglobus sp.]